MFLSAENQNNKILCLKTDTFKLFYIHYKLGFSRNF